MARIVVTNGDLAATALSAHFPDAEILIWRDALVEGPVPGSLDSEALADIRAGYFEETFGMNDVRSDFTRRDRAFEAIAPDDNVELWFETDLHDQLQVIQFLARMASRTPMPAITMTLAPPPLPSHIERMEQSLVPVSVAQLGEAADLWSAFCAPTPEAMLRFASAGGALPDARAALRRMLEELPGADGLGRTERHALRAVRNGAGTPGLAFRDYHPTEELPFLGDLGFLHRLDQLGNCATPLVHGLPSDGIAHAVRNNKTIEYIYTPIALSETGAAVLDGQADFVALNGIDRWVGGVHLTPENLWRYDTAANALMR